MGDAGQMSQSTCGLNINLLNTVIFGVLFGIFSGIFLYKIGNWTSTGVKADFQSSHEAPRSSLRVLASN
jgi:hypothetical protein